MDVTGVVFKNGVIATRLVTRHAPTNESVGVIGLRTKMPTNSLINSGLNATYIF